MASFLICQIDICLYFSKLWSSVWFKIWSKLMTNPWVFL